VFKDATDYFKSGFGQNSYA